MGGAKKRFTDEEVDCCHSQAGRLVTPGDVKGEASSLREAVTENGWPEIGEARGKFIFVFHENENDPESAGIGSLASQGFIVRTRADAELLFAEERRISAIESGAQIVSTDFPAGYSSNPDGCSLHRYELRGDTSC